MKNRSSAILASAACVFAACSANVPDQTGALSVAASFYPLAYIAEQVGGDNVSVTQITPGGVEPHDYDPAPEQLKAVYDAKVFLMHGAGLDDWGEKIRDELTEKGVIMVRMTDEIELMDDVNDGDDMEHPSPKDEHASDPHIWLDPVLMKEEAIIIRDAFIAADAGNQDIYMKNAEAFMKTLSDLDAEFRAGLSDCAVDDIVTSHDAFRYMAKQYGFGTLAIAGLDPEEEPTPKRLAELSDFAKAAQIKYIFFEELVSPKLAQTLADEIGAEVLVLNPIEGLTDENVENGDDYVTLMRQNLRNLQIALQCQ